MRLLIDTSSLVWQSLLVGSDKEYGREVEHNGRMVKINGHEYGYECAINHLVSVMNTLNVVPIDCIFVTPGAYAKARRQAIYAGYKEGRDSRPPEAYENFRLCKEKICSTFRSLGSQIVTQDGVEEDDVIAYLVRKLDGEKVILSTDGDMATLIEPRSDASGVGLWRGGMLTYANPYGPFAPRLVPVYKALVGDGNEYKGAVGFGDSAFIGLLAWAGESGLAALEGMLQRRTLHELADDVGDYKPLKKIIDGAKHVYESYECALLHDEWVDTMRQPLKITVGKGAVDVSDQRLRQWSVLGELARPEWVDQIRPSVSFRKRNHAVFDCELIGSVSPVFLVCAKVIETKESHSFWWHKDEMPALNEMLKRADLTWVSFNGIHFDQHLISAAIAGKPPSVLKQIADAIISGNEKSWDMPNRFDYDLLSFDHIDLIEPAPGVRTSLKTYAGRMGYPTMVDLPFHHDQDLDHDQMVVLETYCQNDLGVTEALFNRLQTEIDLRREMSEEHEIDLRSKSDAQVAEALLKKSAGIKGRSGSQPISVQYRTPSFIETDSDAIQELIERLNRTVFAINKANGQVECPEFLKDPIVIGTGTYQCGIGGLHSTHDKQLYVKGTDDLFISDFDVASYYPNIMLNAGLTPRLEGGSGERFIQAYRDIYTKRLEAKRSGNKRVSDALKISLNGTFGKLGSPYSAFYSPDMMLAVTLTGQLNLLCLIYDMEFHPSINVLSANTDGITVRYPKRLRESLLSKIAENAIRTGFEYEETKYRVIAMKDVNNYIAVTVDGKVKRKGLYAEPSLMKNPTMPVCSNIAVDFLKYGVAPSKAIAKYTDMADFVAIRVVKGGGIQYDRFDEVDDWVCVKDVGTKDNEWRRPCWGEDRVIKRKSRPNVVKIGIGGNSFGRIARWYMALGDHPPINYLGSGNRVPKTDGAKVCMTLPSRIPDDLNYQWYIDEACSMLEDMGVSRYEFDKDVSAV